jgi:dTDP-4-dehydrorhamnose reductase
MRWEVGVVVNCAAMSQPGHCERDPQKCRDINIPRALLAHMELQREKTGAAPLLVHFSTDQVYDGTGSLYREDDPCIPVNEYGKSKVDAERYILEKWGGNSVILRSSLIYGTLPPLPVQRELFLQFVEGALRSGRETAFFEDEYRSPIWVEDICAAVSAMISRAMLVNHAPYRPQECEIPLGLPSIINVGGPERLNRVDMALAVADVLGLDYSSIKRCSAKEAVGRTYPSPADISMDSRYLTETLKVKTRTFREALTRIFAPHGGGDQRDDPSHHDIMKNSETNDTNTDDSGGGTICAMAATATAAATAPAATATT